MFQRNFWIILGLLFVIKSVVAQNHQELLEILESDLTFAQKEEYINSFMQNDQSKLSQKELAECYHDIGAKWYNANYNNSGDHSELIRAIAVTERALLLKRKLKPNEQCTINKTLYNLGFFNSSDNNLYDAMEYFMEVVRKGNAYCDENTVNDLIELSYHGIGELYIQVGDFYKALEIYDQLISDYIATEKTNTEFAIWTYIRLAEIHTAIDLSGNSNLVKSNLDKALDCLKKSGIPCCFYENRINQLEGNRLSTIEDYAKSISFHQKVIENLPTDDSVNLAIANNSLGHSYFEIGERKIAEEILLKAISLDNDFDLPRNNLGDLYAFDNRFEEALGSYQAAIDMSINSNLDIHFDELPSSTQLGYASNKIELLNHIVTKANAWLKYFQHDKNQDHLRHALRTFSLADQLVDLIRDVSNEQESKLYWREQGTSLYMKAVEVCYLLNKSEEAFYFMERNKALLLLEDLTYEEAKDIAQLPQNLAQREYKLKRSIFLAENELLETDVGSMDDIDSLKKNIRESKYVYLEFIDSLNTNYPEYAKFKRKVDVLAFKDIKTNYISDNKAVLHYILNEDQGYGLLSSADTTLLFKLENISKLNWDIEVLIHWLSNGRSDQENFNSLAHTLFENLIPEKVYDEIKGKQLTIIPDYTLQRIPFETLVVDKTNLRYLLQDVEIGYVYSMSLLDRTKRSDRKSTKDLLGVAPVQFGGLGLAELNFSKGEIAGIANVFDGDIFLNGRASKANFIDQVADHKIIHLSTHADLGDGENPWIAFSDSKMYLKEIYATKNHSDMVVLSACNTSNGNLKRGEGLMSLARGFFYSGAKSVVSSLWPITDDTGQEVMIDFYKNLAQGFSKTKALRKAKLTYLENTEEVELKHPFYWAGFVVVGDNTPVASGPYWYWVVFGIGVLVLLVFIFRQRLFLVRKG